MIPIDMQLQRRRQFLLKATAGAAGMWIVGKTWADDLPANNNPRAILGDVVEPNWSDRVTVSVGPRQADMIGETERVIQAAIDYVDRQGGGTVHLLPGEYSLRNSIFLRSNIRLLGSGGESVLKKEPALSSNLEVDGDHWDQEITLTDPGDLRVGDGVRLIGRDPYGKGINNVQRTVIAVSGNRFKLDGRLQERFYRAGESQAITSFALIRCEDIANSSIENIALDGNQGNNTLLDLDKSDDGSIRLDRCNHISMRGLDVHDFCRDGIVWGISHDVLVENCELHDGVRLALHAGSGSQRSIMRGNHMRDGQQGVYYCWGAQHGLCEKNVIEDCSYYGMTLGHRDSDNLIRENDIRRSGIAGIFFREDSLEFSPNRNRIERNRIIDSGSTEGVAIDVGGQTEGVSLVENELLETREPFSRIGIRIGSRTRDVVLSDNRTEGFARPIVDLREGGG